MTYPYTCMCTDVVIPWLIAMLSSRKNPYPPQGRSLEIRRGRGVLKVKILEAKYEAKLEFPRGTGGVQNKNLEFEQQKIRLLKK